ncbi:hypothetical protein Ddye_013962 [Dipteronia dyeriana]|uniref:Uncharacterized protein n=1 Tax=Dipteronia dyeriana TaxID=168575 RepID=A0AAD9X729_9ROSI|nr:hypothetical protein Ddye_032795 [Dipteronia dyeriana]KAK2654106.1 hypothetical protein Ddye_013962 [Dipteronia dyeriana]
MATSKLVQVQAKAAQASQVMAKNGGSYVKQLLEKNKEYIQEPPSVETCQLLAKQLFYTRLASIPKRYEAFQKEIESLKNMVKKREGWNMENAGMAALFGLECFVWFCGGEIVGRGFTFPGYHV